MLDIPGCDNMPTFHVVKAAAGLSREDELNSTSSLPASALVSGRGCAGAALGKFVVLLLGLTLSTPATSLLLASTLALSALGM